MFGPELSKILSGDPRRGGCGMSLRPSHYSGRGATTSDINARKLEVIYRGIKAGEGVWCPEGAAEAFVDMVEAMEELSATAFLITLARLEGNGWEWGRTTPEDSDLYPGDKGAALATVYTVLGGVRGDQTEEIKAAFLNNHGREPKYESMTNTGCIWRRYGRPRHGQVHER